MNNDLNNNQINNVGVNPGDTPSPVFTPGQSVTSTSNSPTPKKNNTLLIVIIVLVIVGIGAGLVLTQTDLLKKNDNSSEKEKKKDSEEKKDNDNKTANCEEYRGIYKSKDNELKVYCYDNTLNYNINDVNGGFADIKNNQAKVESFGHEYVFTLNGDEIEFTNDEYKELNGTYKKEKDYSLKDYLEDNYIETKYFNTKYNGIYQLDDETSMYMFQKSEDSVRVIIKTGDNAYFDIEFDIKEDGSLEEEFFDDIYQITFNGDDATFTTVAGDKENDGTYKRIGEMKLEQVLEFGV